MFREIDQLRKKATENAVFVMKALKYIDRKHKDGLDKRAVMVFLNENVSGAELNIQDAATIFRRLHLKQNGINGYVNIYNAVYQPDATLMTAEKLQMLEEATL